MDLVFAVADAAGIEVDEVLRLGAFLRDGDKEVASGLVTVHFRQKQQHMRRLISVAA